MRYVKSVPFSAERVLFLTQLFPKNMLIWADSNASGSDHFYLRKDPAVITQKLKIFTAVTCLFQV